MTLHAVVFDYGHTIVDFAPAEEALVTVYEEIRALLEAEVKRELPSASDLVTALSRRVGDMVNESYLRRDLEELDILALFATALESIGISVDRALIRRIAEIEHRAMVAPIRASSANLDVLRELRALGFKIGVVSNAHFLPELMREDLTRMGIMEFVDDAVFSAEIGVRKPHFAIYLKVLNELKVKPSEAIFVGDRLRDDIAGAQGLGMTGVLTHEFRQEALDASVAIPAAVIAALPELIPFAESRRLNASKVSRSDDCSIAWQNPK